MEVLVALVLLGAGLGAAASASAAMTRMIALGRSADRATRAAADRLESLRLTATTNPGCSALTDGVDSSANGVVVAWRVATAGSLRAIAVVSSYRIPGRTRADTFRTRLRCD